MHKYLYLQILKNIMVKNLFYILFCSVLLFSCKARKVTDLDYMKNIENVAVENAMKNTSSTLQKGDQLVIIVSARDQDVVKPFNQNYSTSEIIQSLPPGGNIPASGQTSFVGPTYMIDEEGNIDFPVLGKLNTEGKTLMEFKEEMHDRISKFVIDPTINIRITNFKITILGEVNRPGEYTITNSKATLLNALGLAGDLTLYGKRDNVLIVRNVDGVISKDYINLQDASFINSPYFNMKQGDVIYVSANNTKEKTAKLDPNLPIYVSVAGIIVTILALVFKK